MAPQPKYKLTYFPIKALGEPIRLILSYGRVAFEDNRFEVQDWVTKVKPNMPFGKVPVLEIDGQVVHQSVAICRYLGNKYGLGGADDQENLNIDAIVDTIMDLRNQLADMYFDQDKQSKAKKKEPLKEIVPFYLAKFDEKVKANGGFFANRKLSWADLYWVGIVDYLGVMCNFRSGAELVESYRNLKEHDEKMLALPSIRTWLAKRPKTNM